jgi:hypothetical protein
LAIRSKSLAAGRRFPDDPHRLPDVSGIPVVKGRDSSGEAGWDAPKNNAKRASYRAHKSTRLSYSLWPRKSTCRVFGSSLSVPNVNRK